MTEATLVGRDQELVQLEAALAAARMGRGGLLLVAGEAGVGKTRLATTSLADSGMRILDGAAVEEATAPYGPVVAAFRAYLRAEPDGLRDCGPLSDQLALILPELGPKPQDGDRPALFEAICCAFQAIARNRPAAVLLDDLQWADDATLELLPALAAVLEQEPLLVIGTYRSDEMPRGHPVRRLRTELRRSRRLREVVVEPLDAEGAAALTAHVVGRPVGAALAAMIHDRTQGVPFFIEELADALGASGLLRDDGEMVELARRADLPLPESVRDAVLLRAERLSGSARQALEVAAVVGARFDLSLVLQLAGEQGLAEAIQSGFVVEREPGHGAFRHALTREALYGAVTWTRRRSLHAEVAAWLEAGGASPAEVAEHWLAGQQPARARPALLAAGELFAAVHAHRDAAQAVRRAVELWPDGEDRSARLTALDRLGEYAELSGDLVEAARAWREGADAHRRDGNLIELARTERKLAALFGVGMCLGGRVRGTWYCRRVLPGK